MVGRAAYGRPWATAHIAHFLSTGVRLAEPALAEQKRILLEHYQDMLLHFGQDAGMRLARKHVAWYSRGLHGSAEFRSAIMRMTSPLAVIAAVHAFYDPLITAGASRNVPPPESAAPDSTEPEALAA
jgi:tRNA-dihydrouridine synthase B